MKYKKGDKVKCRLKSIDEIKQTFRYEGGRYFHPINRSGANLTIRPRSKQHFGTVVTAKLLYVKPGRNIWEAVEPYNQLLYEEWLEIGSLYFMDEELFEI